jgi:hypothetical protein
MRPSARETLEGNNSTENISSSVSKVITAMCDLVHKVHAEQRDGVALESTDGYKFGF